MEKNQIFIYLDGLFAYDQGCNDSGIADKLLKIELAQYMVSLEDDTLRILLSEFIRNYFLSDSAIEKGYGIEDVKLFLDWLASELHIEI